MKKKVVVGMSGGVDSSVAAYLLKEQGYEVIGVTMRLWQDDAGWAEPHPGKEPGDGPGVYAAQDAGRVAQVLGIPHYVVDFSQVFQCKVKDYFVEEYLKGRTPNPCIACNRHIKWEALLKRGAELGADYIATGHYARIARLVGGRFAVRRCVSAQKDQSYALYSLTQEQLAHTLTPLGEYGKDQIRALAEEAGLPVANKPDSQEICFVPDDDYGGFIDRAAKGRVPGPGDFVSADGRVLGRHKGITHYTIGQRRGLELPMGERVYVTAIRPETNQVVIGKNEDLFVTKVFSSQVSFMSVEDLRGPKRVLGKIRYNHKGEYCVIEKRSDGSVLATFEHPVRAAAPGQSICFYDGEYVLGGGIIIGSEK